MLFLVVVPLIELVDALAIRECAAQAAIDSGHGNDSLPPQQLADWMLPQAKALELICMQLALVESGKQVERFKDRVLGGLADVSKAPTMEDIKTLVHDLRMRIHDELGNHKFAYILPVRAALLQRFPSDWEPVWDRFPDSKDDVCRAVEAYAVDLNTAAVFHLMRVAELGLRHIARAQRLQFKHEIKFENWEKVFEAWDRKLAKLKAVKKTTAREKEIRFYTEAVLDLKAFRDAYRNHVSHAREPYDEHQAMSVYTHVLAFMRRLAAKTPKKSAT